jgi:hypothetical protein
MISKELYNENDKVRIEIEFGNDYSKSGEGFHSFIDTDN